MITDMCRSVCARLCPSSSSARVSLTDISVAFRQQLWVGSYRSLLKVPYRVLAPCMTPLMMINVLRSGVCTVTACERQTMSVYFWLLFERRCGFCIDMWRIIER